MKSLLLVAAAVAGLLILAAVLKRLGLIAPDKAQSRGAAKLGPSPFKRKDYLLTKGELAFYHQLRLAVPDGVFIFAKVRLLDLLYMPGGVEKRQSWQNRVQSKHVDFVLCDPRQLRPLLVIELDDKSHDREDRQDRDGLVDDILKAAGLPIHRVTAAAAYSPDRLRLDLLSQLPSPTNSSPHYGARTAKA